MALTFNFNVNPNSNNSQSLGSSSYKWKLNGYVPELIPITVSASANTTVTIQNSAITADHVVVNSHMQIDADIAYTTSRGSITIACASGIPAMTLYLGVKVGE